MSDEPLRPAEGMVAVPRERGLKILSASTTAVQKGAPFGFARPKQKPHWFCLAHGADGDPYL
jgi:hypothetical protein